MNGWQQALVFLGTLIAAGVLGLFVARVILNLTRQARRGAGEFYPPPQPSVAPRVVQAGIATPARPAKPSAQAQDTVEDFLQKRQGLATATSVRPKPPLLGEVEANLATATAPWTGKPVAFQTRVLDADRMQLEHLPAELNEQLTEAYTDMRLANTLVWLSTDVGRRSQDLDDSYLKLCNKIALRLQRAMADLRRSGT